MPSDPASVAAGARTLLFAPADRPDRFARARASGADLVVLDLEDAVPPDRKAEARGNVVEALAEAGHYCVRINAPGTDWHAADLAALAGRPVVVMLPKAESPAQAASVAAALAPGSGVVALIETALGVLGAPAIAAAPDVVRLALGSFDLAAQLALAPDDREALSFVRGQLVVASAAAGLAGPVDGVTADIRSEDVLLDDLRWARRLGFAGKLCIHPAQVAPAARGLAPEAAEVDWARAVVSAADAASGQRVGVAVLDGRMVDKPVVDRARRILLQVDDSLDGM